MTVLNAKGLCKAYGSTEALGGVSFGVERGEVLAVVGPNGSGKTTLLRIIAMLEQPTAGRLSFNGSAYPLALEERRRMAMVFQTPAVFNASVFDNASYGLRVRGLDTAQAHRALRLVGLHAHEQNALTLSAGEAQRLSLASAIAVEPELLLLDEPTANLDPRNVKIIENAVVKMKRNSTIVMVTHNLLQAGRIADRIMVLINGRIAEIGDEKILKNTESKEAKAFVSGKMIC
jgi:tungstate transport system ATP-binding protein